MQVGFDSVFFGRIDYQDREKRKKEKSLEVIWRGSKSLGSSSQVKHKAKNFMVVYTMDFTRFSFSFANIDRTWYRFLLVLSLRTTNLHLVASTMKSTMTPPLSKYFPWQLITLSVVLILFLCKLCLLIREG